MTAKIIAASLFCSVLQTVKSYNMYTRITNMTAKLHNKTVNELNTNYITTTPHGIH